VSFEDGTTNESMDIIIPAFAATPPHPILKLALAYQYSFRTAATPPTLYLLEALV